MKIKFFLYSCLALLLGACKKEHSDSGSAANTWNFRGPNYTAATVVYVDAGSQANLSAGATGATANSADGLVFLFTTPPTGNGQMLITDSMDPNTVMVSISKLSNGTTTFYTNAEPNIQANITVNGGKVSASFPGSIWLHNMNDYSDSAQLSVGTITQQ